MPYKNIETRRQYMKTYMRRQRSNTPYYHLLNPLFIQLLKEFKERCILPRHMYQWKGVMRDLIKHHFCKRVFKIGKRTELITQSYNIFKNNLKR